MVVVRGRRGEEGCRRAGKGLRLGGHRRREWELEVEDELGQILERAAVAVAAAADAISSEKTLTLSLCGRRKWSSEGFGDVWFAAGDKSCPSLR